MQLPSTLTSFFRENRGATAIEYGLIAAIIVLVVLVALTGVSEETLEMYNAIVTAITQATAG